MTDYVWVTFAREGIHCYPAARTDPALESVSFLASPHRHMFHFKVWIEVFHNDRDREFIMEKRWMESLYGDNVLQLDFKSCEMMAQDLAAKLADRYVGENRKLRIEVSEDLENGCLMEFEGNGGLQND